MKRIEELTHDEILNLTDEEIQKLIEIEIAENGIMPAIAPKELSLENSGLVKSERFYEINNILFKNKEEAVKVASMDIYKSTYNYSIGYDYVWPEKIVDLQIKEMFLYKQEDVQRVASIIQMNEEKKSEYEKGKKKYDDFMRKSSDYRQQVWQIVNDARDKEQSIQNAVKCFGRYKELAEGDMNTAIRFFENTFKEESKEIKDIVLKRLGLNNENSKSISN